MTAFFGQTVQNILSERIFEAKRVTKGNSYIEQEDQEADASGPEKKEEILVLEPEESARPQESDGPAKLLPINMGREAAGANGNSQKHLDSDQAKIQKYNDGGDKFEGGSATDNTGTRRGGDRRSGVADEDQDEQ